MELDKARTEINKIDKEIVRLLEKRFNIVNEIGNFKKKQGLSIYDEAREKQVVESCTSYLENKEYSKFIDDIYFQIMKCSNDIQQEG
jgi:monofunctional chorismate mutase